MEEQPIKYKHTNYDVSITLQENYIVFLVNQNEKQLKSIINYDYLSDGIKKRFSDMRSIFDKFRVRENFKITLSENTKKVKLTLASNSRETVQLKHVFQLFQVKKENWTDKPYEILVGEVEVIKSEILCLRSALKMDRIMDLEEYSMQDKEDFFSTEKKNSIKKQAFKLFQEEKLKKIQLVDLKQASDKQNRKLKELQEKSLKVAEMKVIEEKQSKRIKELEEKLLKSNQEIETLKKKMSEINEGRKQSRQDSPKLIQSIAPFINFQTPFAKHFQIQGNRLRFLGKDGCPTQLLMKKCVSRKTIERFHCKILQSQSRQISIGIVDRKRQERFQKSYNSGNAVCYYGRTGRLRYGDNDGKYRWKSEGNGFFDNEVVTVEVNLIAGNIKWLINNKLKTSINLMMLEDENREFVPYIELEDRGDMVEWFI